MKTSALFFLSLCVMTARAFSNQASSFRAAPTTLTTTTPTTTRTRTMDAAASQVEAVVRRYFAGVHNKDAAQIRSCFGATATIRDVCGLDHHSHNNNNNNTVAADVLVQRCMDFVTAHPDCAIDFYYGPTCEHRTSTTNDNDNDEYYYWVWAHWYERGTWSGESCGLTPTLAPMACEGQTRFRVHATDLKIVELVVTRTFTQWETAFIMQQQQQQQQTNTTKQGQEESSSTSSL